MKVELVTIGNFIENLSQEEAREEEGDTLRKSFWEYVAGFWPLDPHPPGSQLENMYRKILKTEQESNKTKDASQTVVSNGASASSATAIKS